MHNAPPGSFRTLILSITFLFLDQLTWNFVHWMTAPIEAQNTNIFVYMGLTLCVLKGIMRPWILRTLFVKQQMALLILYLRNMLHSWFLKYQNLNLFRTRLHPVSLVTNFSQQTPDQTVHTVAHWPQPSYFTWTHCMYEGRQVELFAWGPP